ncbi:hypothetical protein ACEPAI_2999 [Sanghuangporus weigelae]
MSCAAPESVVASPKTTRSVSVSERRPLAPVTPQRNNRANKMRVASSPLTPSYSTSSAISSPFTPITNVYSSSASLVSPNSSVSTKVGFSPEPIKARRKSIADATQNWRSRAKENGIKVDGGEASYADSLGYNSSKDSIPESFLSTHRRSRQAAFKANSADDIAFASPKTSHLDGPASAPIPSSLASSVLNTPESTGSLASSFTLTTPSPRSSLAIVQRLRQRGSLTDPARPRRRHISGPIFGEALFDIDEDSIATAPYPETFGSPIALRNSEDSFAVKTKRCVSAPFIAGRFYEGYNDEEYTTDLEDDGLPNDPQVARTRAQSVSSQPTAVSNTDIDNEAPNENMCSVCSAVSSPLSFLDPCGHLVCSSCLTSSLNIVGEKDMSCATCDKPVRNFRLLTPLKIAASIPKESENADRSNTNSEEEENEAIRLLPSAMEDFSISRDVKANQEIASIEDASQKNSPTPTVHSIDKRVRDVAVLRIDNVPWDVTPTSLNEFFSPFAVFRVHVLLDPKGKTLSHAYVEVPASDARNALRSVQNKSLGKGRRLRGVTVTMSGQVELMRALFPSWLGGFDGNHPTLGGLDRAARVRTLENGLITLSEIDGLAALMKNPKSHFLKVPTLPFYSLASILSKFPVEGDSRVFWSSGLRDILYELTTCACDLLIGRINTELHDQHTLETVVSTASNCQLFTDVQRFGLFTRAAKAVTTKGGRLSCPLPDISVPSTVHGDDSYMHDDGASSASVSSASIHSGHRQRVLGYGSPPTLRHNDMLAYSGTMSFGNVSRPDYTGLTSSQLVNTSPTLGFPLGNVNRGIPLSLRTAPHAPYDALAREFNIEPDVVAALAQRLVFAGQAISPQTMGAFLGLEFHASAVLQSFTHKIQLSQHESRLSSSSPRRSTCTALISLSSVAQHRLQRFATTHSHALELSHQSTSSARP